MIFNKKGQSMSLNVIIVAALALIVMVVLIAIFTGKMGDTNEGLQNQGNTKLNELKSLEYASCHPNIVQEAKFLAEYKAAEDPVGEQEAINVFRTEISRCSANALKADCDATDGCSWN
jgi:hypothetical protein